MAYAGAMPHAEDRRTQSPQSVTRVIHILEALARAPGAVGLADLSRMLGSPKSSLAALLRGLAEIDFVIVAEGAYRLGPGAFGLGSALMEARRHLQSSDLVRQGMRRLAERSGETVLFAVRADADTITYVDAVESRNAVRFAVAVGDRRPLYSTAGGRMLLATGPQEEVPRYLDRVKPVSYTPETITAKRALADAVAAARDAGVAQTVGQSGEGITGTAAPIHDATGTVLGALVVAAPSSRSQDRLAELVALVTGEAAAISRSLGYRAPL
ncbi:IclR family transcriptional regulator [Sphingomonas naphthae]|uniref:IclR family transcriptional regulator n=1 Tax=Sphingomonas naphthae TaxID=1813468 RepID=A0ABY7TJQ5_9SPHN|nr:IclR family transcriptional regulator [Sphingomonas naphthae]WCT73456.1 IclR family transcriptional regulator [Sphingomonas naphthae]